MPRGPRLDAPSVLHHVMARGIERRAIFRDDADRAAFVARWAALAQAGAVTVYAWALLPNHVHLLVRTGTRPLATVMRSILTGYAGAFNRRHKRSGHLFQNRYKSIVVEEEPYLLELVRYLHLNPLRAQTVPDLRALDRYPWTGHSALLGTVPRPWQATAPILGQFGPTGARARKAYRTFVAAGVPQGRRPELQGGGLVRSAGGWRAVTALRRGREACAGDERILGRSEFVERVLQDMAPPLHLPRARAGPAALLALMARVAALWRLTPAELTSGSRRRVVARARAVLSWGAVRGLGLPIATVARALTISPTVARDGIARGETLAAERGIRLTGLLQAARKQP